MLTKRQNLVETIRGGNPDRYVNQFEFLSLLGGNPYSARTVCPAKGGGPVKNQWGVTTSFPAGVPAPFPVHDQAHIVIKDIEDWKLYVKAPNLLFPEEEWEPYVLAAEAVDRREYFAAPVIAPGIFEQCHYLMEIQNCMVSLVTNPDEMHELIDYITQWQLQYAEQLCKYLKPDAIFLHDDWGSQRAPFFSIATAREMFVPIMKRFAEKCKELGFVFQLHSCGKNELVFPAYMEGGVQMWNGMYMNDKKALFEQYGQNFVFGVDPPDVAKDMEASHEALEAAAKEFCEFFIRDGKCHAVANTMRVNPYFVECVYKISRQMLNS